MPTPKPASIPAVVPFPQQTCFSCAEREGALAFSRILMLAEIRRLEVKIEWLNVELERRDRAIQREAHHIDGNDPHRRRGRL